jgi:hypothetical protein
MILTGWTAAMLLLEASANVRPLSFFFNPFVNHNVSKARQVFPSYAIHDLLIKSYLFYYASELIRSNVIINITEAT